MILVGIDTNLLIYAADRDAESDKHRMAAALLKGLARTGCGLLPLQALAEFYAVTTRKNIVPAAVAAVFADALTESFPVHEAALPDIRDAMRVHRDHGIAFWDGMLWSVVRRAGARILLSEDFQDGRVLEGVRFVNPFPAANASLIEAIVAA
jgi:predicted nucleic acid-binding protein